MSHHPTNASTLIVDATGPVARLTLNRPERRNALSLAAMRELLTELRKVGDDERVAVVVIAGAGPAFSAGHDLSEMVGRPDDFYEELFATCVELMTAVHEIPQPVIARARHRDRGGMPARRGVRPRGRGVRRPVRDAGREHRAVLLDADGARRRAIGRKRALELLLTGDPIDAATAADWGLVNRVVPPDELDAAVDALAARICRSSREGGRARQARLLRAGRAHRGRRVRRRRTGDDGQRRAPRGARRDHRVPREAPAGVALVDRTP